MTIEMIEDQKYNFYCFGLTVRCINNIDNMKRSAALLTKKERKNTAK